MWLSCPRARTAEKSAAARLAKGVYAFRSRSTSASVCSHSANFEIFAACFVREDTTPPANFASSRMLPSMALSICNVDPSASATSFRNCCTSLVISILLRSSSGFSFDTIKDKSCCSSPFCVTAKLSIVTLEERSTAQRGSSVGDVMNKRKEGFHVIKVSPMNVPQPRDVSSFRCSSNGLAAAICMRSMCSMRIHFPHSNAARKILRRFGSVC
mmetsp:Transcript_141943/g.369956  ORF Transcript_141943/g.369956 Transcript_141943/m.369956 type:complete len:213 (+) Transcript_141943:2098-2736(+)